MAASKSKLVNSDKDSNVDDPIRLYLREIGKENLLTAEQEVELSKTMEEGNNIIKDVIKNSGIMLPEFFAIAQKAFTRIDIHESGKTRKELNEEMADNFFNKIKEIPELEGKKGKELNDIVILASIVEREYKVDEEAPIIASVFTNRIKHKIHKCFKSSFCF